MAVVKSSSSYLGRPCASLHACEGSSLSECFGRITPRWTTVVLGNQVLLGLILAVIPGVGFSQQPGRTSNSQTPTNNEQGEGRSDEKALALYADAANFQNNGELALAIEQWQAFLKSYPKDPLAPKASHYLGVCLMQLPEPKYDQATQAFEQALKTPKFELREESLANVGWCSYALGSNPESIDNRWLQKAINAYSTLLRENPNSRFADRAHFYTGEAQFSLGQAAQALASYDRLLASRTGESSALRCDALYAKGIAHEELKQYDQATTSYRTMLSSCADHPLAPLVKLQLAEVLVLQERYTEAEPLFAAIISSGGEEKPRALSRRAFVLAQLDRADEAAKLYDQIIREYPNSPFAASALLAAAQSFYRAGQYAEAAQRFESIVSSQQDLASATEAAHWLSVLAMRTEDYVAANRWAQTQIDRGLDGPFALMVRLDAAEALSMQPEGLAAALPQLESLIRETPVDNPLFARILYNAAFTAFQLGEPSKTLSLAKRFDELFPSDPLAIDVRYLAAEAHMQAGDLAAATATFDRLLATAPKDHPQRTMWTLRAAAASLNNGNLESVLQRLTPVLASLTDPEQKAEGLFLIGTALLGQDQFAKAAESFEEGLRVAPNWNRKDQVLFRLGVAQSSAENPSAAKRSWERLLAELPTSSLAPQAQYRLAQEATSQGAHEEAIKRYSEILENSAADNLRPFALYGKGWALLQKESPEAAVVELSKFIDEFTEHPLRDDALLARGICNRKLANSELAKSDFEAFLKLSPTGEELGSALLELALIDRERQAPQGAVQRLQQIVREVPGYSAMPDVLYELAWNLKDSGQEGEASRTFAELTIKYPDAPQAAEANYQVGQFFYEKQDWNRAEIAYQRVVDGTSPGRNAFLEKSLYRLGWTRFQKKDFDGSIDAFNKQITESPEGELSIDALMMIGEGHFAKNDYDNALKAYKIARETIQQRDGENKKFVDLDEQQVRELVFLHGGQSASQLKQWDTAIEWYNSLRKRYPSSNYLAQVFYETGFAHQQLDQNEEAIKFYTETANNFRDESAARARFMLGEIYFQRNQPAEAIVEFKRVMYGFGAEKAPASIQDWQAKSGFEAGRCAELLIQANQGDQRRGAIDIAIKYYEFVATNHPQHELAKKATDRLEALKRM